MLVELFISDHSGDIDALSRRLCQMAHLEALHGLDDLLDRAVILFDAANSVSGWSADNQPVIFNGKRYCADEKAKCHDKERTEASQNCLAN